jgi:hypothetical protein
MAFKIIDPNFFPPIISKKKFHRIIIISDTHIGGVTGYLSIGCVDERGNVQYQTVHQEIMEKNLLFELSKIGSVDIVIFLGDMIEGKNPKAGGMDVSNVNTDIQIDWAVLFGKSIIDILKPKIVLGLHGSDYHVESGSDKRLIYQLSLHYSEIDFYFGQPSLKFFLGDKLWYLQHRFTGNSNCIVGVLERYWNMINKLHWDRGRTPDVIGYGHIHKAVNPFQLMNGKNPVYAFVAPCQKVPDSFCSKGPVGALHEIGFMYMEQDGVELTGKFYNTYRYWDNKKVNQYKEIQNA